MASRYSIEAVFKGIDRISAPVRAMQRNVERAVGGMQRSTSRVGGALDRSFRGALSVSAMLGGAMERSLEEPVRYANAIGRGFLAVGGAAVVAGAAVAGVGASIVSTGASFERTLMSAVARFPGEIRRGSEEFENLRKAAERVGATTEFDAQQAAGALNVFAAAGFTAQQAIASLAGAGDLATVSGLSLDQAASTAADSLGALGLQTQDATQLALNLTRVNDLFARTTGLANTSATEMAEAVKVGGNVAMQSGASIETFGALVAAMARSNIKGAEAGTAIRNMFAKLQRPSAEASRVMRRLGVDVADSSGNMRSMESIIGDLARSTAGMGEVARNEAIANIFGLEAMPAVLAAMNAGEAGLANMRTQLEQSQGAAANMAATMRDTAAGDIDGFTSAVDGVKTAIFGLVSGPLRDVLKGMTDWIAANTEWISSGIGGFVQGIADNFSTLVQRMKGVAVFAGGLLAIAAGIRIAAAATAAWNVAVGILNGTIMLNPFVAVAVAIVAAIALIVAYWPEISGFFQRMWDKAKSVGSAIGSWFSEKWAAIKTGVSSLASAISSAFSAAWEWVVSTSTGVYDRIVGVFDQLRGFFAGLWSSVAETFTSILGGIMDRISSVVSTVTGIDGDGEGDGAGGPQVVSPQERTARQVSESTSTSRSEVTIRDQTGRAEITRQPRNGPAIRLQPSGGV